MEICRELVNWLMEFQSWYTRSANDFEFSFHALKCILKELMNWLMEFQLWWISTQKSANDLESSFQSSCINMHFEGIGELVDGISSIIECQWLILSPHFKVHAFWRNWCIGWLNFNYYNTKECQWFWVLVSRFVY